MTRGTALLRVASLATAVIVVFAFVASSGSLSSDRVRDAIDPLGLAAVPAFIAVSALLTCALFPGPLLAGASGLLFGTALGTPVSITAATLGAVLAFGLARFAAHDAVETLAGRRLAPLQEWIERRGFWAVLYARIAPGVPYSLVNYAAGLTRVPLPAFAAATALGAAPRAFAYTALGGSLDDLTSPEAVVAVVALVVMALAGLVLLRAERVRDRAAAAATAAGFETATSTPARRSAGPR
ncbi:MAG TPA: TVP38/TMEM64 family protein [Solirubrobacteraceae bacterium]|nr:TVP38/TMEM64 family protein [Solirubrobacteraceae bacterium]